MTKRFGDVLAVEELSLAVEFGAVYGLVGPNGAGKTTTLQLLAGLLHPDEGPRIDGIEAARRRCGCFRSRPLSGGPQWTPVRSGEERFCSERRECGRRCGE